jgi:DNA-binding NarL/FixJ family response regulator
MPIAARVAYVEDDVEIARVVKFGLEVAQTFDVTLYQDARAALEGLSEPPAVLIVDVGLPDLDGIAATRELSRSNPDVKVLILTTFEEDDYIFGALRAGASGFLLKRTRPEELIAAVHTVATGDSLLSPSVTRRVIDRMAQQPTPELAGHDKLDELTPREREVLELIARGLSNREIAEVLTLEESTVRTHVKRILAKLGLRDRVQAVIFAYETGIKPPRGALLPVTRQGV